MDDSLDVSLHCWVYRSSRRDELYVYLRAKEDFDRLPEALLALLGTPELVMDLVLHKDRKLARAHVPKVMEELRTRGYYLQMPPPPEPKIVK